MAKKVTPGALCRIIGASNPNSPIIGRRCKVLFAFTDRPPHSLWGQIWRIASVDGDTFVDGRGDEDYEVNVAEDWLEVLDDDPDTSMKIKQKELATE